MILVQKDFESDTSKSNLGIGCPLGAFLRSKSYEELVSPIPLLMYFKIWLELFNCIDLNWISLYFGLYRCFTAGI